MPEIPRDRSLDSTFAFLFSEGYCFITNRCKRLYSDLFRTRVMLKKAVCMQGAEAARISYHPSRFNRRRALPLFALTLIQDLGSVMVLDNEDHRRRKAMFMSLMSPAELARLVELTRTHWLQRVPAWQEMKRVSLFHEAHIPLCSAICEWAGLRLPASVIIRRAGEFEAMVEGTGAVGPRNWRGQWKRARTERWMRNVIRQIRSGKLQVPAGTAAQVISSFRGQDGKLLDIKSAAVELINVLRPTIANARYIVFAAMALDAHPEWRTRIHESDDGLDDFVDEVRRFYPFIPTIGGRVLTEFVWRDHTFKKGDWVLMDLYGTNHDVRIWGDPENFRPERFREQTFGPFDLVSHGAGDRNVTHRCPGEWMTVEQMKCVIRILVREMRYELPAQDLQIDLARIPALPRSGLILMKVGMREAR